MTTAKWMLFVIAASATSSYITFHLTQSNKNELSAAPNAEISSHLKDANSNAIEQPQDLAKTKNISANTHDNQKINLSQAVQPSADKDDNNANQAQSAIVEDMQFAYEKKQNEIASFREFIEKTGDNSLSVISKNYDSEPINPEWAKSKENELLTLLGTNETLQNMAPLELSCKSQNCRLVLSAQDENQGQSLYSAFKNQALQGSDENKQQIISYFRNPDRGEIYIYLSKNTFNALRDGKIE